MLSSARDAGITTFAVIACCTDEEVNVRAADEEVSVAPAVEEVSNTGAVTVRLCKARIETFNIYFQINKIDSYRRVLNFRF